MPTDTPARSHETHPGVHVTIVTRSSTPYRTGRIVESYRSPCGPWMVYVVETGPGRRTWMRRQDISFRGVPMAAALPEAVTR